MSLAIIMYETNALQNCSRIFISTSKTINHSIFYKHIPPSLNNNDSSENNNSPNIQHNSARIIYCTNRLYTSINTLLDAKICTIIILYTNAARLFRQWIIEWSEHTSESIAFVLAVTRYNTFFIRWGLSATRAKTGVKTRRKMKDLMAYIKV